jgi:hypothetical protein
VPATAVNLAGNRLVMGRTRRAGATWKGGVMKAHFPAHAWLAWCSCLCSLPVAAQTRLPGVTVIAPLYTSQHGGYLISGDFRVDPHMPYVAFPAQALVKGDILSIQPINLADNEYLVLQECAVADCSEARLVRVWNSLGATSAVHNSENRARIGHENKYFIWLKRLPEIASGGDCDDCGTHFHSFEFLSPPLTLIPSGALAAHHHAELAAAESADPIAVQAQQHEGSTYVLTFTGGSQVRIKRMHAAHDSSD